MRTHIRISLAAALLLAGAGPAAAQDRTVEEARPAVLPPAAPPAGVPADPAGVVIRAGDFSRLYVFYADLLGLRVVLGGPDADTAVFDAAGFRIVLAHGGRDWDKPSAMRFLFPADDLPDRLARLQRVGIRADEVRDAQGTLVGVYFQDPENNPLGFVARGSDPLAWARPANLEELHREAQEGRLPLMIFGGIYGLWLGVAIPTAADVDEDALYGLGIIVGVPAGVLGAYMISGDNMTRGRAGVISWAGAFGTWQGLGWASEADADDSGVLWSGILGGLGGIAASTLVTRDLYVSRGQSTVMTSASVWGGWYGAIVGENVDDEYDDFPLAATLVGSAIGYAGGIAWAATGNDIDNTRANVINLSGFAGAAVGLGVAVVTGVDEGDVTLLMGGAGSLGAKVLATLLTVPKPGGSGALPEDGPQLLGVMPTYSREQGAGLQIHLGF